MISFQLFCEGTSVQEMALKRLKELHDEIKDSPVRRGPVPTDAATQHHHALLCGLERLLKQYVQQYGPPAKSAESEAVQRRLKKTEDALQRIGQTDDPFDHTDYADHALGWMHLAITYLNELYRFKH